MPIYNYFQAALILFADETLSGGAVLKIALEMIASREYSLSMLANSLQDLLRRGRLSLEAGARLAFAIERADDVEMNARHMAVLPPRDQIAWAFATRVKAIAGAPVHAPPADVTIDYIALLAADASAR